MDVGLLHFFVCFDVRVSGASKGRCYLVSILGRCLSIVMARWYIVFALSERASVAAADGLQKENPCIYCGFGL